MIRRRFSPAALLAALALAPVARAQTTTFNGVQVPGVVIAHVPKSTGNTYASPTMTILADGTYLAAHDSEKARRTMVYRSADRGATWTKVAEMDKQGFSNLFALGNTAYLMGTSGGVGSIQIRRSDDGGKTWTTPDSAETGLLREKTDMQGFHTASVPVAIADGRVWRGYEDKPDKANAGDFRPFLMSAPVDADLLKASSWTYTNSIKSEKGWLPDENFKSWREATVFAARDGHVGAMIRVDVPRGVDEYAAILKVDGTTKLTFDPRADLVKFNGGAKKFTVRYDRASDRYYSIVSLITDENRNAKVLPSSHRNIAAVVESKDLHAWSVNRVVLKYVGGDMNMVGFQYWDWQFDGRDIVAVSRTAFDDGVGGPIRFHDANFFTFHRFENVVPAPATQPSAVAR